MVLHCLTWQVRRVTKSTQTGTQGKVPALDTDTASRREPVCHLFFKVRGDCKRKARGGKIKKELFEWTPLKREAFLFSGWGGNPSPGISVALNCGQQPAALYEKPHVLSGWVSSSARGAVADTPGTGSRSGYALQKDKNTH